ncbi:sulfite exporter TauE/SafE family protein [Meiothermus taiwanensis]|uniref:urease accessory protein UreH domain-containing protein n=1 Tax=Meiothermus taiwanensis TaxID=172827 RepID=UPI00041EE86F|nr:sulfite exporter TauE/SafE family protein [Meiothermus taiwanensis]
MAPYLGWGLLAGLGLALVLFGAPLAALAPSLYALASQPYAWLAEPINTLRLGLGIPLLSAFLLGLLGALAPCQLSTNAAALSWLARDALEAQGSAWKRVGWFLLGKALVYLALAGVAVWVFGGTFTAPGALFTGVRRVLGPLMVLMGFLLLGLIRLPGPSLGPGRLGDWARARGGSLGAFTLGAAFGLAFCPTMFFLFFGAMLPAAVASRAGLVFPALFALGTAVPVLLILALLDRGKPKGEVLGEMRRGGRRLNLASGVVLVVAGLYDTLVYWFL